MEWAMVPVNDAELHTNWEEVGVLVSGVTKALAHGEAIGLDEQEIAKLQEFASKSEHPIGY